MVSEVYVIGMGMGNPDTLTLAAHKALAASGLIIGAERLLDSLGDYDAPKRALVRADQIERELRVSDARVASVVMSGDIGFYSGATRLLERLSGLSVTTVPGVSSLSYLCARLRLPWQDAHVVSVHGREADVVGAVQAHAKTFVLTDGRHGPGTLCARLAERGLGGVTVSVGERLSYPDERVRTATAAELAGGDFGQPAVMLVRNQRPLGTNVGAPHLPDAAFERGDVPMTKEEVRELAVCKLRVRRDSTVWDVGAGTGSVSVECARQAVGGQVLAIERDAEALGLIRRNREAFDLPNLRVVAGEAPEALDGLPAPDQVFVGGSGGRLRPILRAALDANPSVRVVIAAITLETLSEAVALVDELGLVSADITQLSVAKARSVGRYHMMTGTNPVYLVCAEGGCVPCE